MIELTKLNGESFILNAELIQFVEARPDTYVTLANGQHVIVQQSIEEVMNRAVAYQRSKQLIPTPSSNERGI